MDAPPFSSCPHYLSSWWVFVCTGFTCALSPLYMAALSYSLLHQEHSRRHTIFTNNLSDFVPLLHSLPSVMQVMGSPVLCLHMNILAPMALVFWETVIPALLISSARTFLICSFFDLMQRYGRRDPPSYRTCCSICMELRTVGKQYLYLHVCVWERILRETVLWRKDLNEKKKKNVIHAKET